jgi:hypothetical protein
VERGEFINAGIIVFSLEHKFLEARILVDEARLTALWPQIDFELVRRHLEAIPKIAAGDPSAGPIARLSQRERFHWLVSPRSTIIQVSPVHTGLCEQGPGDAVNELAKRLLGASVEPLR